MLEPEPPPLIYLGLREPAEWKIFYTLLLEWFVRTDEEVKEWEYAASLIYPTREELLKDLVDEVNFASEKEAKDWFRKVDNVSRQIVIEWRKDQPDTDKYYRIARLSDRTGKELDELRETPEVQPSKSW